MNKIVSLFCGIIFGIGLVVSEMINPAKVLGFLNLFDAWDPSLAFVMIGALIVSTPLFHLFKNKDKPLFNSNFSISTNKEIDKKLIIGSVFFGAGWGLAGLCPGPAISSIAFFEPITVIFLVSMVVGILIYMV